MQTQDVVSPHPTAPPYDVAMHPREYTPMRMQQQDVISPPPHPIITPNMIETCIFYQGELWAVVQLPGQLLMRSPLHGGWTGSNQMFGVGLPPSNGQTVKPVFRRSEDFTWWTKSEVHNFLVSLDLGWNLGMSTSLITMKPV